MSEKETPRLLSDGSIANDVTVNPKYLARVEMESSEQKSFIEEQVKPWGREKIERELARLSKKESFVVIDGKLIKHTINLHGVDLSGQDLTGLDLSHANLHGANLSGARLTGARLVGANLHGANLSGAILDGVNAVEANFHGACLCRADVSKTHFMKANLSEACHETTTGLDLEEKPMTPAEVGQARYRQSEGSRASVSVDEGLVRYYGDTLKDSNVTGMVSLCKRKN